MSRTNPNKKKRRSANKTLLIYCEGLEDKTFLEHLRSLYARNSGVGVKIRNGKGGNAKDIVVNANKEPGDFDKRIAMLDNDKDTQEMDQARKQAKLRKIEIIENSPCLEAMLLSILTSQNFTRESSSACKKEFESNYVDKKKRTEVAEYRKYFPKEKLNDARKHMVWLNKIISLMENNIY